MGSVGVRYVGWLNQLLMWMHYVWHAVVYLKWKLDGKAVKIQHLMNGDGNGEPAQVLKVIWRNPFSIMTSPHTFFTVHERFTTADVVLNNRVHLLSLSSKAAIFTEVDDDILEVRKHPFHFLGQTKCTTKLIILPATLFYKIIDDLDVSDRNVVWLFRTSRSGSTAWVQAFNSLPGWVAFSEPRSLYYSVLYGDHGYDSAESYSKTEGYAKLVTTIIKFHLSQVPKGSSVFWKANNYDHHIVGTLIKNFPLHKMLLAYRDIAPSITSFQRSFGSIYIIRYACEVVLRHDPIDEKWWSHIPNTLGRTNGYNYKFAYNIIKAVQPRTVPEWFLFVWASMLSTLKADIEDCVKIKPINYDSLVKDRRGTVAKVFDYLDIPAEYVEIACQALNEDSQAGVGMVSHDTRKTGRAGIAWREDEGIVKRCNMILEAFKLPSLDSSLILPADISSADG